MHIILHKEIFHVSDLGYIRVKRSRCADIVGNLPAMSNHLYNMRSLMAALNGSTAKLYKKDEITILLGKYF